MTAAEDHGSQEAHEDLDSFRQRAREFIRGNLEHVGPVRLGLQHRPDDEELATVAREREVQRMFFDAGFAGICVPLAYGGQGLTPTDADPRPPPQLIGGELGGHGRHRRDGIIMLIVELSHQHPAQSELPRQDATHLGVSTPRRHDLDLDDPLVAGTFQVARDRRGIQVEIAGDLALAAAMQIMTGRDVDQNVERLAIRPRRQFVAQDRDLGMLARREFPPKLCLRQSLASSSC